MDYWRWIDPGGVSNIGLECGSFNCFLNHAIGGSSWHFGAELVGGYSGGISTSGVFCYDLDPPVHVSVWTLGAE